MNYKQLLLAEIDKIANVLIKRTAEIDLSTSLLGGRMGLSIFFFEYYKLNGNKKYLDLCLLNANIAIESISSKPLPYTHCDGFAGILSGVTYLSKQRVLSVNLDTFSEIDQYLYKFSMLDMEKNKYDFLHGGLGACFYFLSRLPNHNFEKYLKDLLQALKETSIASENGVVWIDTFTTNAKQFKEGVTINLGMAHGLPSIIAILSKCLDLNICIDVCLPLLKASVNWLMSHKLKIPIKGIYGCCVPNPISNSYSPLGWCYGDPGIIPALIMASRHLKNNLLLSHIDQLCYNILNREDIELNGIRSPYFCHGTAGFAHILQHIYSYNNKYEFILASKKWINETISWMHKIDIYNKENSIGILDGFSGVGLTLISSLSPTQNQWSSFLLIS